MQLTRCYPPITVNFTLILKSFDFTKFIIIICVLTYRHLMQRLGMCICLIGHSIFSSRYFLRPIEPYFISIFLKRYLTRSRQNFTNRKHIILRSYRSDTEACWFLSACRWYLFKSSRVVFRFRYELESWRT